MDQLTELSATDWLVAGSIVLGAFLVGMVLKRLTTRVVEPHGLLLARLLGRFALAGTLAVGLVYALNRINVAIAPLLGFLGLFGLAFALAFQEVLGNFIAGVMLSIRRPFKAGDEVSTSGYEGRVEDVNLRTTTLRLFDGVEAYIPNSMIWSNPIENFTARQIRRTTLDIGVGYGTDLDAARALLVDTLDAIDQIERDPRPQAFVHEFGESSINIALMFWHSSDIASQWEVRDRVARDVKEALDDAGVEIPFPHVVFEQRSQS